MTKRFKAKVQVSKELYFNKKPLNKDPWMNIFYQINDVLKTNPKKLLIIGVGNGIVPFYFRNIQIKVKTLDIDPELNPSIVGSVTEVSKFFKNEKFDTILCAHTLEHVPFKNFNQILRKFSNIAEYLILQLPPSLIQIRFNFAIQPYICDFHFNMTLPILFWKKYKFNGEHYWQPYRKNNSMKRIKKIIKKYYKIIKNYQNPYNHYSYHFILESRNFKRKK